MPNKMGRPRLPKGTARTVQFAIKLSRDEARQIERDIKTSGKDRGEWGRDVILRGARPPWIISRAWSAKDLQGKSVEFDFSTVAGNSYAKGIGIFWVYRHEDEVRLGIEIHPELPLPPSRIFLEQEQADVIIRHHEPGVADFLCRMTVGGLSRQAST